MEVVAVVGTVVVPAAVNSKMAMSEAVVGEDAVVEIESAGIAAADSENLIGTTAQTVGE